MEWDEEKEEEETGRPRKLKQILKEMFEKRERENLDKANNTEWICFKYIGAEGPGGSRSTSRSPDDGEEELTVK